MATITDLNLTDSGATSRTTINDNFDNLNSDKAESSTLTAHTGASTGVHGVTGSVVGSTDTQTLTNKTLTSPTITTPTISSPVITGTMTGSATVTTMTITGTSNVIRVREAEFVLNDNTTADVTTSKHGLVPKAPNSTTQFLRGDATWATVSALSATCGQTTQGVATGNNVITHGLGTTPKVVRVHAVYTDTNFVSQSHGAGISSTVESSTNSYWDTSSNAVAFTQNGTCIVALRDSGGNQQVVGNVTNISGTSFTINFELGNKSTALQWEAIG